MAAYGLYSHIESNKRRSIALLVGLFATVYLMVYAGALTAEALSYNASLNFLLHKAWLDLLAAAPYATAGTIAWIAIAYYFHQSMIDAVTGAREVTRADQPRLYNLLENLCISRGITMPKLRIMDSDARPPGAARRSGSGGRARPRAHPHPQRRRPHDRDRGDHRRRGVVCGRA